MAGLRGSVPTGDSTSGLHDALVNHNDGTGDGLHSGPQIKDVRRPSDIQRSLLGQRGMAGPSNNAVGAGMKTLSDVGNAFNSFNPVSNLNKVTKALTGQ